MPDDNDRLIIPPKAKDSSISNNVIIRSKDGRIHVGYFNYNKERWELYCNHEHTMIVPANSIREWWPCPRKGTGIS